MCFGKRKLPKHLLLTEAPPSRNRSFGWLLFAAAILFGSMLISLAVNADQLDDAKSGQLLFQNSKGLYDPSLHLESRVDAQINGLIAAVTLEQKFQNQTNDWQEGVYIFPLPENAAVSHMEMIIGERRIIGKIKEKEDARKIYQEAKASGKRAALTEQRRPNLFTQRIANIPPGEEVTIKIRFRQSVGYEYGQFSWRLPTTFTPTHSPTAEASDTSSFNEEGSKKKYYF